jgi:transposase
MRKIEYLREEEKKELEEINKNHPKYTQRNRAFGILMSYRGYSPKEIAELFTITRRMVYNWLDEFEEDRVASVYRKKGQGRKPILKKS